MEGLDCGAADLRIIRAAEALSIRKTDNFPANRATSIAAGEDRGLGTPAAHCRTHCGAGRRPLILPPLGR
jgi:hypothetical protein